MKKIVYIFSGLLLVIILVSSLVIHFIRLETLSITTKILLLILFNLNVFALLTLIFFVIKALTRLYLERKQKILGSRFKTKIVTIFVILISIPSALLFLGASGLVTNYIDRWFTPQFRQPIDSTLDIARVIYETEREKTLSAAKTLMSKGALPPEYSVLQLKEVPENPSDVMAEAFEGREGTEIISGPDGDLVRAVVPEISGGKIKSVIIVESRIPAGITKNVEKIKNAYEEYVRLETWKQPLKLNYLLFLSFFTLIVIFMAIWISLRIARTITEPIQNLAQATEEIAAGNLSVNIGIRRNDEIGLLINSFNHMVKELKDGKESLQESYSESNRRRLFLENILKNIKSGVIFLNSQGNITTINSAACSILNVSPDEMVNKSYREILRLLKSDALQELIHGIKLETLKREEREVWTTVAGMRKMFRISIMGLRDEATDYLGILVVFDDLTDVVRAEKALTWQDAARRIAHEIKNPLTPIKLSTERMLKKWENRDEDFGQVFVRSTKNIIKEVDSLRRLVDEFTRFGKMPEINKAPRRLRDIIDDVVGLYRDFKDVSIRVSVPGDSPLVDMDGEQFKRVLINLFDNAIQAMKAGGKGTAMSEVIGRRNGGPAIDVRVEFNPPENRVLIDIADNGPGIRDEDKDKLFLPYFSTRDGGTGLGLAIASRIIAEHRGYLRVRDNEPQGSVFTIEMPIKEG